MISRALPLEGAPLAVPGPYEVASGPAFGSPGHVVFHPADLDAFPAEDSLPVMAWGNGGCAIDGTRYSGFLTTIASHGFLVLSTAPVAGAGRGRAAADVGALDDLHGPVLLINGGEVDFMYEASASNFDAIGHVPVFYGARDNAGHTATVFHPGGGEFANVASNWLRWILKGDDDAGAMFRGLDCTLCTDPNWETRSKGWE